MSVTITEFIEAVKKVAEDNPAHVDSRPCVYVKDGQPKCIIGQAAWKLGLIDSTLEDADLNREGVHDLLEGLGVSGSPCDLNWLEMVQNFQDDDVPWGDAVHSADLDLEL